MTKALNFNNLKKRYWTVTLPDENQTTLLVTTPTKGVLDSLIAMKDTMDDDMNGDAVDDLYDISAKILSRNKTGRTVRKEDLEDMFDFEDIIILIREYTNFISEVTSSKN